MEGGLKGRPSAAEAGDVRRGGWLPGTLARRLKAILPDSLQGVQLLLLLIVLVPLLLVQGWIFYSWFEVRSSAELEANLELARAAATTMDSYVQDVLHQEYAIGVALTSPQPIPSEQVSLLLGGSVREYPSVRSFTWVDPQGRAVASSSAGAIGVAVSDRTYFQKIAAGQEWVVSDLETGRVTGGPIFLIARGMRDQDHRLLGVVVASVDAGRLDEVLKAERSGQAAIAVFDRRGWLIYRDPELPISFEERDWLKRDPSLAQALAGQETTFRGAGTDGVDRLGARTPIASLGWVAAATRPVEEILSPLVEDSLRSFGLFLLVAVAAFLGALRISAGVTAPVKRLRERALDVGKGELESLVEAEGVVELRDLSDAFNRMSTELRLRERQRSRLVAELKEANQQLVMANLRNQKLAAEAEEARRQAEDSSGILERERDTLQAIMENTQAQLAYLDPQFNFVRVNSAYVEGSGHSREELLGKNHFELFPNSENLAIFEKVRDTGEAVQFFAKPFDYVDQPKRGTTYWDWSLKAVKDGIGKVQGLVFSLLDVTDEIRTRQRIEELAGQLEADRGRLEAVLRQMPAGVIIVEAPSGRLVLGNGQVEQIFRQPFQSSAAVDDFGKYPAFHQDGTPYPPDELPIARSIWRGEIVSGEEIAIRRVDGSRVVVSVSSAPIRDREGRIVAGVATFYDVTERKQVEQFREEYISLVSHDLRNPLTAVKGHADLLARLLARQGMDRELSSAEAIAKGARQMNSMIQELVESARLESGRMEMREEPADLCRLVRQVAEEVVSPEEQRRIVVETPEWIPAVLVDVDRIERAIMNLVTNALKYSPRECPVVVRVERRVGEVVVSVIDRGAGIPTSELPRLFQRFYRIKSTDKVEGLGLGLYITRLIVEAHGGHIWVESRTGEGSSFSFSLPLSVE